MMADCGEFGGTEHLRDRDLCSCSAARSCAFSEATGEALRPRVLGTLRALGIQDLECPILCVAFDHQIVHSAPEDLRPCFCSAVGSVVGDIVEHFASSFLETLFYLLSKLTASENGHDQVADTPPGKPGGFGDADSEFCVIPLTHSESFKRTHCLFRRGWAFRTHPETRKCSSGTRRLKRNALPEGSRLLQDLRIALAFIPLFHNRAHAFFPGGKSTYAADERSA